MPADTNKPRMGRLPGSGKCKQTVATSLRLEPETRQLLNTLARRRNETQAEVVAAGLQLLAELERVTTEPSQ